MNDEDYDDIGNIHDVDDDNYDVTVNDTDVASDTRDWKLVCVMCRQSQPPSVRR